jgi:DNA-binding Lrp family transcriptional regulator
MKTPDDPGAPKAGWTFLTNHAHVLVCIARDPHARIRDLAERVGITERAVLRIIVELEHDGYLTHTHEGRRNSYRVSGHLPLRHPIERNSKVSALLALASESPSEPDAEALTAASQDEEEGTSALP